MIFFEQRCTSKTSYFSKHKLRLWVSGTKLLLLHTCSWKKNRVPLDVKCGFNLLHSLFCFVFLCFISLHGVKLWPWKVRKWRKWKSEIWGVWGKKARGSTGQPVWLGDWNVSGLLKLITLEPAHLWMWTPISISLALCHWDGIWGWFMLAQEWP